MIRALAVLTGHSYSTATGLIVRIEERVESGVWLARNSETGAQRYVVLGDLVAEIDPTAVSEPAAAEAPQVDYKRAAAGDRD